MNKKPTAPGLLPPDRVASRASNFANNPLRKPATRGDLLQITKAMMNTWRAVDGEFAYLGQVTDYLAALSVYLALPWYRRLFTAPPVFPARPEEAGEVTEIAEQAPTVDPANEMGDISTAHPGDDGPESEGEL
jgi:hypothetical protein